MSCTDRDWRATAEALEKQLQEYDRIMFAQRRRFLESVYRWAAYSAELEQQICDLEREQAMVKDSQRLMFSCRKCNTRFTVDFEDGGPAEIIKYCENCGLPMIVRPPYFYALNVNPFEVPEFEERVLEIVREGMMGAVKW